MKQYDEVWNLPYIPVHGIEKINYGTMTTRTPPLVGLKKNCVIHSFTTMCHNLLVKVAKVVQINKYCPKRPKKNVNGVQWIWKIEF